MAQLAIIMDDPEAFSLVSSFEVSLAKRKGERMKEREEAIDQPLTLSKLNKSSKVLSLSSLLGPSSSHFLIPP